MQRCLQLAALGAGTVAPNPMVGSVLVYNDRIIGEGYHQQYGKAHAEVNCIASVKPEDEQFIAASTIYVSLEPCAHFGKTPPCADLIISKNIRKVVVGCRDPFKEVDGKGIEKLRNVGIEVVVGILEKECKELNKRFFTFHIKKRPYIILKWAQSADHFIAANKAERTFISNDYSNRLVHKWRSEEAGILVGTRTALLDNPSLSTRLWIGSNPVRILVDKQLSLPSHLQLFDGTIKTIIFNYVKQEEQPNLLYELINDKEPVLSQIMEVLYRKGVNSLLVEGGAVTLQRFINEGLWDEARIITNQKLMLNDGVVSPRLKGGTLYKTDMYESDSIAFIQNE
jgi:diaminohydroxyphosphoribosylaminopyrimidine deaminase/5-amino-6-(5-phosphoribosylamino)uracil reductase